MEELELRRATGKWLLFGDADDCFLPGWFDVVKSHYEDDEDAHIAKKSCVLFQAG